jgi:hypothetical protein
MVGWGDVARLVGVAVRVIAGETTVEIPAVPVSCGTLRVRANARNRSKIMAFLNHSWEPIK